MRFFTLTLILVLLTLIATDACTTILVGKGATKDGSTMVTHNNDCTDCDVRIAIIPEQDHKPDEKCEIYPCKFAYPRFVGTNRGETYLPARLDQEKVDGIDSKYPASKPISTIPQVPHTYSYIEGTYPIANQHQLSMGESTCAAKLISYGYPLGDALYDVSALMRVAMERCTTARCAITIMGELAEQHGYYGANDPPEVGEGLFEEAGEAVTIIDPHEAWVFHILPDDTGKSAVWAAQRIPDNHFTVVANKFIIREMDLDNKEYFLASKNMIDVAVRAGFWKANSTKKFDFSRAFAPDADDEMGWADRRTWHLYNWVAPSKKFKPNQKQPFPFSVEVEYKLSLDDIMAMNRDHFEGTQFDLSIGPAAGPYNNPNRYDRYAAPEFAGGFFERGISLHRTSYSFVAQSRSWLPDPVGGVCWFAHHAPHSSTFIPLYTATTSLPASWMSGNLFQLSRSSAWWAFAAVENYSEKQFNIINEEIKKHSSRLERQGSQQLKQMDQQIVQMIADNKQVTVSEAVTKYTNEVASSSVEHWWQLFDTLLTKFRDGQVITSNTPPFDARPKFYPAWWLGRVGYYDQGPMTLVNHYPKNIPKPPHMEFLPAAAVVTADKHTIGHAALGKRREKIGLPQYTTTTPAVDALKSHPSSSSSPVFSMPSPSHTMTGPSFTALFATLFACTVVASVSFFLGMKYQKKRDYAPIV